MGDCTLCGLPTDASPVRDADVEGSFCCQGCLQVYRTLDAGDTTTIEPDELRDQSSAAETETLSSEGGGETAYFSVDGMHCTTCEAFIETTATETEGIIAAQASYATDMAKLIYDPAIIDRADLAETISTLGYHASDPTQDETTTEPQAEDRLTLDRLRTVFGALAAMTVMVFYIVYLYPVYLGIYPSDFLYNISGALIIFVPIVLFSTIVLVGVGYPILRGAYISIRARQPNMDVLIAVAAVTAYLYSLVALVVLGKREVYFDVSTMIIVVVSIGNYVENKLKRQGVGTLAELTESRVTDARVLGPDGSPEMIDIDECAPGDQILVKPGERIPVDGTIIDGTAAVDESIMTGEAMPKAKETGDGVIGGSIVTDSPLVIEIGEEVNSTLDQLMELLWTIQSSPTESQRLANRLAALFVPAVIILAVLTTLGWTIAGAPIGIALITGVSVLVVSCPCSLGLATPLAIVSGVRAASERQLAVLNSTILEGISDTDIVAFDKTGTLTTGEMAVQDVVVDGTEPETVLARAAAIEERSNHPIAAAITAAADPAEGRITDFDRHSHGVAATIDGERVTVGHPDMFASAHWTVPDSLSERFTDAGQTDTLPTVVGWNGMVQGVITISDTPRDDWQAVVQQIDEEYQCRVVVITGDDEGMAQRFAAHSAIDEVFAGIPPEAKESVVRQLREEGSTTMIGDGTNDAPALASADLGVAMANGTEMTMDAADAVITTDTIAPLPALFTIARETRQRIRQNFGWALCYNLIAVPLAMAGIINPLLAAVAMGTSSLIVVLNSARGMIESATVSPRSP
jgi:Cu2+-exporting ATPase